MKLEGKIAAVTGGGAGIGEGIVKCLAEEGADIAVIDITSENAEKVSSDVQAMGRRSLAVIANVTEKDQADYALKQILDSFGRIDILVNNVGGESKYYYEEPGVDYSEEKEWDDTIRLNLRAAMLMTRAVTPLFINQKSGKIVNISSIGGRPMSGGPPASGGMSGKGAALSPMTSYGVAKAGVIQFSRLMALQLAPYNINVNCVCPGVLYTPLYERSAPRRIQSTPGAEGLSYREYFDKYVASRVPLGREQTPEDIGRAVVFLTSEEARNITGQSINVDGGLTP
ncbi:MAG: SDR family oxidoreductase [Dehalococcoidales bacterium]|nr:MAG: SDR family oxidoreductase [Dehalococcoidales bacterium]